MSLHVGHKMDSDDDEESRSPVTLDQIRQSYADSQQKLLQLKNEKEVVVPVVYTSSSSKNSDSIKKSGSMTSLASMDRYPDSSSSKGYTAGSAKSFATTTKGNATSFATTERSSGSSSSKGFTTSSASGSASAKGFGATTKVSGGIPTLSNMNLNENSSSDEEDGLGSPVTLDQFRQSYADSQQKLIQLKNEREMVTVATSSSSSSKGADSIKKSGSVVSFANMDRNSGSGSSKGYTTGSTKGSGSGSGSGSSKGFGSAARVSGSGTSSSNMDVNRNSGSGKGLRGTSSTANKTAGSSKGSNKGLHPAVSPHKKTGSEGKKEYGIFDLTGDIIGSVASAFSGNKKS